MISKRLFSFAKSSIGDLIVGLVFGKLSRVLPVKRIKETNKVIAFWHPRPFWEKHILIVPKKAIKKITLVKEDDLDYVDEVFLVAKEIVNELEWERERLLVKNLSTSFFWINSHLKSKVEM